MATKAVVPVVPKGKNAGAEKTESWYVVDGKDKFLTPVVYVAVEPKSLNESDKIARLLMSMIWSSQFDPQDFLKQNLIGQGTLAVATTADTLYVAGNDCFPNVTWEALRTFVKDALAREKVAFKNIVFVKNPNGFGDRSFHAEAQLVWYLHKNNILTKEIGVSKPCCQNCALMLDRVGLAYSYWHEEEPPKWVDPKVPDDAFVAKKS